MVVSRSAAHNKDSPRAVSSSSVKIASSIATPLSWEFFRAFLIPASIRTAELSGGRLGTVVHLYGRHQGHGGRPAGLQVPVRGLHDQMDPDGVDAGEHRIVGAAVSVPHQGRGD